MRFWFLGSSKRKGDYKGFYSENSKIIEFKAKDGEIFEVEIIENPSKELRETEDIVMKLIKTLTRKARGNLDELVEKKIFPYADILLIVRNKKNLEVVGYATGEYMENNKVVFLSSTMLLPKVQNRGIGTFLNHIIVKEGLKRNKFRTVYFVTRTPNPIVFATLASKIDIVPSIRGRKPSYTEVKIASKIASKWSPNCKFNPETFVIEGAYLCEPELIYNSDKVPWSHIEVVNKFCESYLRFKEKRGNAFVIVGKISPFLILKEAIKDKLKRSKVFKSLL